MNEILLLAFIFPGRVHPCGCQMEDIATHLARYFTQSPWYYLSWPAVAMVVGALIGMVSKQDAEQLAVVPRTSRGLVGLVTAPFVHASFAHLMANLPPFLVLGVLVLNRVDGRFPLVALAIMLASGLLLWAFGRGGISGTLADQL